MKFRNLSLLALALCATGLMAADSLVQASATVTTRVQIIKPITITAGDLLNFGSWVVNPDVAGNIVVSTASVATPSQDATGIMQLTSGLHEQPLRASFTIGAEKQVAFTARVSASTGNNNAISYSDWTILGDGDSLKTGVNGHTEVPMLFGEDGILSFDSGMADFSGVAYIGAKLNYAVNTPSNHLTQVGSMTLNVAYN